jgi:hypothetical protein
MKTILNCTNKSLIGKQFEVDENGHMALEGGVYSLAKIVVINGISAYDFTNLIIWAYTDE